MMRKRFYFNNQALQDSNIFTIYRQRDAVDIVLYQSNQEAVFNPNKLGIELHLLQLKNNDKIVCRFRYIGGVN